MTREKFVTDYAKRSGLDAEWAALGILDVDDRVMLALPCGCGADDCEGWAMVSAANVLDHLFLYSPDKLMASYRQAVIEAGGE